MSENTSFEPEVVVLYCQRCVREGADVPSDGGTSTDVEVETNRASGFSVQPVMIPCSSKIEVSYILKILERGADAVEVIACPADGCQFLVGSLRAEKRIDYVRSLLDEIHVGAERVGISRGPGLSAKDLIELAAKRAEKVKTLGPNPMNKRDHLSGE
jgi:F420-non-reducing hydrogenase iron-sulfur subunit